METEDVIWCENCTELVVDESDRYVHAPTGVRACADNSHDVVSVVRSTPAQRDIVIRLKKDYPEYQFTVEFGTLITAWIPGALTHLSESTEEALVARLDTDRSRRRWAFKDAQSGGGS